MADGLTVLADALSPSSSGEFIQKLRTDDAVRLGLNTFCSVLRSGVQSSDDGTSRFLSWTDAQIHGISSFVYAIASASRSLSVEQSEGVLVAIVQQSIEFALCYLENSGFDSDDLGIQNNMIHLLEMALVDGINVVADVFQPTTASALVDILPVDDCCSDFVDDYKKCHLEGFRCSKEEKSMDWLLKTLASECLPHDRQESGFIEQTCDQYFNNFLFLSQHWAVVHGKYTPRLILLCNKLAKVKDVLDERAVGQNFRRRLSFILRILKILGSLLKDVPYVEYDATLMKAVATFCDALCSLFRIKLEFVNTYATTEGSFDSIVLMVIEEFIHSIQVIFGNSNVAQNIQTCIIAAILESLDSSVWTYDKSSPNLKPPLAYFPRFVVYMLKLINDLKRQTHQIPFEWKNIEEEQVGSSIDSQFSSPSCLHHDSVPLLKGFTFEEILKLIFPVSSQWITNLMQLALFLHSEGLKLRPKLERSHSSLAKVVGTSEVENAVCHEDEALFGDLFSETGRSVGSTDGCEQPPVNALVSSSSYQNMPMQAAVELLSFLKTCIFSAEWHPSLYADACNKLGSRDIDILLSLLNCQGCCCEDNMSDSCTPLHDDGKIGHVHDLCFDLLRNLLTNHALNDSLEDYLVDKILTVENGSFCYNDRTLTLLAHTLFSRVGSSGSQLRTKICRVYVGFVVEKAKTVCIKCSSINDLAGTLPLLFHIEVVLMAFHLSSEGEKAVMAKLIFSSLKEVANSTLDLNSTLLTCWALVVSRLILILRHMIFHQHTCPTSLLLDVRSKLREAPLSGSSIQNKVNDHMSSWSSTAFRNIGGGLIGEETCVSSLIGHLIDISGSSSLVREGLAIDSLALNWEEIYFTFSLILGFWKGKRAAAVEDLIVERYVFSLCWDIPYVGFDAVHSIIAWDQDHPVDLSNMLHFFHFSHLLLGHPEGIGNLTISPHVILSLLQHLNTFSIPECIEQLDWYFLRSGMWLSLVLSFTNVGIWKYVSDNAISGHGLSWTENGLGDDKYVKCAGNMISSMIESGQFALLVKLFSSLLNKYLQVCQTAFLDILSNKQKLVPGFSPLLLLKHTEMDQSLQDELLQRSGSNAGELQSILSIISRLDTIVDKKASGILSKASWECLLHGFPFNLSTASATMFSCVLSVRGIIFALNGLLRIREAGSIINMETEVLEQVLDAVTIIKYDRIFESVHGQCDTIYHSLSAELELSCYENLVLMKQMEGFLKDVNAGGACDCSLREWIVCKIIEMLNSLRKDPSKSVIFHFYLGVENLPEKVNRVLQLHLGDCLVLIDSLDSRFSESVNVKVLGFFVDLLSGEQFPDLRMKIQRRFLDRDVNCVSQWLERRLLGSIVKSDCGVNCANGSSISLRESTMNFILCLVSPPSEQQSKELQQHIFNSALGSLDSAFLLFDIHVAKSFFNFIVQISRGDFLMKQLLMRTIMLMEKLVTNENLLPGLKFLFGFIETVLSDCGSGKISLQKATKKCSSGNSLGVGHASARLVGSRKNSETYILSANQEGGSASLECDATSVDEDEDDATSDGEVLSIDKDDEEDANSERALASKVCTFTSSGSNFMEQHWYFCYTCDLTVSKGCCSVCAKVCHRGHRVVYSRSSRFFCDCGAGGVRGSNCQCLKPRKFTGDSSAPVRGSNTFQSFLPFPEDGDQLPDSDSDFEEEISSDADNSLRLSIPKELQEGIPMLLEELDIESRVLNLCSSLLPFIRSRRDSHHSKDNKISTGEDKVISHGIDLLQLKKAYKSGSFDLKIKVDYSNAKELKSHLASGSLVKSLLSVSVRGRLAIGEGDKVAIYDVGQLIGQATIAPVTADKTNVKPLSKNIVRFEIVQLAFNPVVENYLLVAGYEDCQVLTLNPRGEVIDRLAIELALQGAYIRRVDWVPGSQVQLMVVTNRFVKIYDLSLDNISPMHYFTLQDDMIVDAVLCPASQGRMFLLVLSENGNLFSLELSVKGNVGAVPLKELVQLQGKEIHAKGSSLYFSSTYKLLFVSFQDGTSLVGRPSPDAASLVEVSSVYEEQESNLRPGGVHHWKELLSGSGLFVCLSTMKSNSALTVSMGEHEIIAQCMRHSVGSTSPIVGMTAYKPLSKDKIHCFVLHDDGSLQIYSHTPAGVDASAIVASEKVKKLGSGILNKAYAGTNPEFPLDFFEKTVCITPDVKLGGDAIRNGDSEGAKQSFLNEDGFLESPSPAGFKISIFNSNPDIVMVGFRVHVGNTSASHIPSSISIFQRVVKLDEGMRSWYDIPFTVAESLLADEEFTISVGPTFNGSTLPRIDSLEVYGRAKDEFGWKEKMDAVLDMEARALGSNSSLSGSGKKRRSMQSAPIQEQVIADGLKLITKFYSSCRQQDCSRLEEARTELEKLKCKPLLETIFECDREPILQASASRVLQAIFPKKEIYHQVKDTMRLLGVVKSSSILSSRLGIGGASGSWIIEEFTTQMRAVCKIALQRRSNLAAFLETNGSEVVDVLMQVLWGILDFEQPDTQTMNNIVMSAVELIYCYAECLALHGKDAGVHSVAPSVVLLKKLLFSSNEAVQTASSLAISSRLLQVPFPKQTMLATDDAVESVVSVPGAADSSTGNNQIMIEDDTITSSVQYCCDGCSTVPILRRRWHCTVCPDFDLCEACYELDADRLPPPHSRDHPMTAIPIEVDSVGDGSEFHFTADDVSDQNLMPVPADSQIQNSSPSIHVLELNDSGDFAASLTDPVSISASKRAINSLLLSELLEQLKGWMDSTSGVQAIPVMQLFYRLSSAVGGPFIDSSKPDSLDLEKVIKWFLDEINLNRPFVARYRSSFGEVAILVFMFFTLMLRNWHQPGSDGSMPRQSGTTDMQDKNVVHFPPSTSASVKTSLGDQEKIDFASQLLRACDSLRQQSFVNYLMDILQQLVHVFKSPVNNEGVHSNTGPGCGALLTVRRDLPAGNFSPFFSDSYVKVHRTDIFMDYHRLLLENAFRLVYTLVRPEKHDKTGEKEKVYKLSYGKDLKLDGYQDVLCSYINNPHTNFVRRYARRLFLHLCGSKSHYYSVRDSWQFSSEAKRLYKHINKSGGFQNNPIPYERSVKIVKCLSTMAEVAAARPRNWQKYCLRHGDILSFLINGIFYFGEESVIQTLKLLNFAFYTGKDVGHTPQKMESGDLSSNKSGTAQESKKKKKGEDGAESGSEKSYLDMEAAVDVFTDKSSNILKQFIDCFLLEWNSITVRAEAKLVLYGVWHHAKPVFKETILSALLQKVKFLPMYGQNIVEYTELVTWLLGRSPDSSSKHRISDLVDRCLTPDVIRCIFETLHSQNELLANHPNSRIYNTLSGLVEFDGYYLESEPCVACSTPEVPYSKMKLESLKSETKFTDNRIIVKCTGSYTIQTVTMNVHDARKSKSVKVLNLYYNNRPVTDLSELKNNWSLWKRAKSCHLAFNQTELKVEFPIPITACNFMIELDSFYENLQALSLEPLQCPRCSRPVTDKHGICSNCHENAYQCRQCRNINYENLDSFLCNECGYSKYGRFEFNFMAKPSFTFDNMENDEDMKKGLAAIESESENAHRRYQQLLGFKKPLLKIVSSIGDSEIDSQQKDSVQQMMVSLPGPSCKINRKIALLGVLYGEKCKAAFDSVSKSVQTLQGLRKVLMNYLHQKHSDASVASRFVVSRSPNNCYGCATTFVTQCLELLQVLARHPNSKKQLVSSGILSELFENNIHQGAKAARVQARIVLCSLSEGDVNAVTELNSLIQKKVLYCLEHHRSMDIAVTTREELLLLSEVCSLADEFWESRLRVVFQLLFSSIKLGAKHPAISEHVILPCLRIISQACTPPKPETPDKEQVGKSPANSKDETIQSVSMTGAVTVSGTKAFPDSQERNWDATPKTRDIQLLSYSEWEKGASYLDFVRRQYKVSQAVKGTGQRSRPQRHDYLALKYALRWKRRAGKAAKSDLSVFELGSWVKELVLSACSQSIRSEMCTLISMLCAQSSSRRFRLLNLVVSLLPATLSAGESAAEYFELLFKMVDSEESLLFLTVRGCLRTICTLITQEVNNVESLERSLHIDITQGFILHKLIELLGKFLEVPNIRSRFMRDDLLSEILEALIVIRGLIVQKTKLISDCNRLLKDLLDSLLLESSENKRQFIRACVNGLEIHREERKGRACLFILEQLCNVICPSKPEPVYLLVLNKAHTQEEFIRGSMTKNPYSSVEIGPLMRDVKNKICHQLELLGLLEDDYGMELLVAGNIISLDLSIAQVYEQVWKKSNQSSNLTNSNLLSPNAVNSSRDCPPMTVTYRLQGLDGEATEPMIKELEEDREESQDPEVEFAIAGAVRECGGLEILLSMIQRLRDDFKSNQEQLVAVLNLLMYCCKIRENRRALLKLGALGLLLETARRAFSVDAMEPAEGILLIVESLTLEANESDNISITQSALTVTSEEAGTGEQAKKIVLMFLERLSHPLGLKKSNKQQRNTEMVARILPYLTYGEPAAMEALIEHFSPYLQDWGAFDHLQKQHLNNPKDDNIAQQVAKQRFTLENFVRVSESLKTSSCGERLKDIILEKGITKTAITYLKDNFANTGQAGFKNSAEWAQGLTLPSVPLILSLLRGLSMGHMLTQKCIDEEGILPLLHALEGVTVVNEIGVRAENLLDTLSNKEGKGDGFLEEKVCKLRHATRDEMRRRALRKREELLQGLGMRQEPSSDGGERIVVSLPVLEGLEDVQEEEDGLACMVCREGYSLRPADLLGAYSYSKRVNLGVGSSGSARGGECVYTTVSYFNIIHFQCHQEAKRADAALRNPKKEWDGATLRNNESLCNSLFPVRGPSVPLAQYLRHVDQYWDNLNALGRADGNRLRLLTYDIVLVCYSTAICLFYSCF
ncbi:E3 ubiquitin-protein ligase UBR4 [Vigna unguiculata]|uniref:Auxin transport protein BIG n=1 Tax=Vigna unguiculata TaxID=3917 RepID=A0A4D6NIC2_VIGUN|nr:E3 ubiquitin-protein ligase UBR4 [Vigna unguiculata]